MLTKCHVNIFWRIASEIWKLNWIEHTVWAFLGKFRGSRCTLEYVRTCQSWRSVQAESDFWPKSSKITLIFPINHTKEYQIMFQTFYPHTNNGKTIPKASHGCRLMMYSRKYENRYFRIFTYVKNHKIIFLEKMYLIRKC